MKKILISLMIFVVILLVSCGYKPKFSDEFYIDYVKNYNENAELYELQKKDTNITIKDKKEIDRNVINTLTN